MILLDTSGLLAALDSSQAWHAEAVASLTAASTPLLLSPFVLAELDYLLATRVGDDARAGLLAEVARGAYALAPMAAVDVGQAHKVIERHAALGISLADASIVVLAERHNAIDVLTLDERHFRVLAVAGKPFRVLPADAWRTASRSAAGPDRLRRSGRATACPGRDGRPDAGRPR